MNRFFLSTPIKNLYLYTDIVAGSFGIFDRNIKVAILLEKSCIDQFIFSFF
ncbi:MAG: hypothetical protein AB7S94_00565 [Simkaniaceae bacterium]